MSRISKDAIKIVAYQKVIDTSNNSEEIKAAEEKITKIVNSYNDLSEIIYLLNKVEEKIDKR